MVDNTCDECDDINKTYYATQTADAGAPEGCSWRSGHVCGNCDPTELWIRAYEDGLDYFIEAELGDHVWRKNYGTTKPDMCALSNESLPHVNNSGDCDSSSATLVISATVDGHECETDPCTTVCSKCSPAPSEVAVDLGVFGLTDDACDACDTISGIYVAENALACEWRFCQDDVCTANQCSNENPGTQDYAFQIRAFVAQSGSNRTWNVTVSLQGIGDCVFTVQFSGQRWTYISDVWTNGDCWDLADVDGKVTLDYVEERDSCTDAGKTPLCTGPPVSEIEIWDAEA